MVELVIVVVIIGIISAIAIPRFGGMSERAQESRVVGDLATLNKAVEMYAAEHWGKHPGFNPDGSKASVAEIAARLVGVTYDDGTIDPSGHFGPYLRDLPANALNGMRTMRVDGAAPGAGTHGWHYDTTIGRISSDVAFEKVLSDGSKINHLMEITKKVGL